MKNIIMNVMFLIKAMFICLAVGFVGNLYAFTIDDFASGHVEYPGIWVYGTTNDKVEVQTGTMLGGQRTVRVELVEGTGFTPVTIESITDDFVITNGVTEITLVSITWDAMPSPVDMTEGGASDGLYIILSAMDINPLTMIVNFSDGTNSSQLAYDYPTNISGTLFFPYAELIGDTDMTAVTSIQIQVTSADPALDIKLGLIETRPSSIVYDLGDNPDSYATLLSSGGAQHAIGHRLYMGSCVDKNADGIPTAGADGDNANTGSIIFPDGVTCNNDEDGVINPADLSFVDGESKTIKFNVYNATTEAATLSGWIDFNCNGQFEDDERAEVEVADRQTTAALTFTAAYPRNTDDCLDGEISTYARFRLSTDTAPASPTGLASDGEVEDYLIHLNALTHFYDQGDAPDGYGTTLANNGPSHEVTELTTDAIYMGSCVDAEDNGTASNYADADNNNNGSPPNSSVPNGVTCNNDEDGVINPADLSFQDGVIDQVVTIKVNNDSSNAITLSGWIDFDCNGSFDLTERVQHVVSGNFTGNVELKFSAPLPRNEACSSGDMVTYSRFRLSSDGAAQSPTGAARDGEVEDHPVQLTEADRFYDQGDAPNNYATLLADNGPSHEVTPVLTSSLYMGSCVDSENDGQPNAGADGDDDNANGTPNSSHPELVNCNNDENGINPAELSFVDGESKQIAVSVANNSNSPAVLYGWIDFDCSGSFDNTTERDQVDVANNFTGNVALSFTSPSARAGDCANGVANTYARFRLSTDIAAASPVGPAPNGEVEDYTIAMTYEAASLGDTVWEDTNNNGLQDESGTGIEGVTIVLNGNDGSSVSATTDASGNYLFSNLIPGVAYTVQCNKPLLYNYSEAFNQNGQNEGNNNADANGNMGTYTLSSNESEMSVDCGLISNASQFLLSNNASLGDTVWEDLNGNGQQDADEPGIANVTITLTDSDGAILTTTTDASGYYLFSELAHSVEYTAQCVKPEGYEYTPLSSHAVDAGNDNNAQSTGNMGAYTLASGEANLTVDCGLIQTASLGDTVWLDSNANGQQDDGEAGLADVVISLSGDDGSSASTATNASGDYLFEGLTPGVVYSVQCFKSADYEYTPASVQTAKTEGDNNADSTGNMGSFTLTSGEEELSVDCGLIQTAKLGDTAWVDTNGNGTQDADENGIANVTITLTGTDGSTVTTTTDAAGNYLFAGLTPGVAYTAQCEKPMGYEYTSASVQTAQTEGDNNANSTGNMGNFTLTSGEEELSVDCGLIVPVAAECFTCDGKITQMTMKYNGAQAAMITISQKKGGDVFNAMVQPGASFSISGTEKWNTLGTQITIIVDGTEHTKIHTSCSVEIGPGYIAGDFEVTEARSRNGGGTDNGGLMCPVDAVTPPPVATDCQVCDGKVTQMTMQYNGSQAALVTVSQKSGGDVFNQTVQPGASFSISGTEKWNTLGTEITIKVDGSVHTKMHTSCSVEIGPGYISGDFEVIEAYSRNGGLMCAVN